MGVKINSYIYVLTFICENNIQYFSQYCILFYIKPIKMRIIIKLLL
jgi:hypothetical protein